MNFKSISVKLYYDVWASMMYGVKMYGNSCAEKQIFYHMPLYNKRNLTNLRTLASPCIYLYIFIERQVK